MMKYNMLLDQLNSAASKHRRSEEKERAIFGVVRGNILDEEILVPLSVKAHLHREA